MSTEVATTAKEKRGFRKPQAPVMPTLNCVGNMGKIENAKVSKSERYITVPMEILGKGAGKNHKIWFTFHPEWLDYDFDVNSLEGKEGYPNLVYSGNIASEKGLSVLEGISGSPENFAEISERLAAIQFNPDDEVGYCRSVTETFKAFFKEFNPLIGYTLAQKSEKCGKDEEGKNKYQRTGFYEIFFWYPSEEKLEEFEKKAAKAAEKYNEALAELKEVRERNKSLPADQQEELPKVPKLVQVTWNEETPF